MIFISIALWRQTKCYSNYGTEVRDLTSNLSSSSELSGWTIEAINSSKKYTVCDNSSDYFLGGPDILLAAGHNCTRNYASLEPRDIIYYTILFQLFDYWDGKDTIVLQFGDRTIVMKDFINNYTDFTNSTCGSALPRPIRRIRLHGKVFHNSSSLTFKVVNTLDQPPSIKSYGFREVVFLLAFNKGNETEPLCSTTNSGKKLLNNYGCSCAGSYLAPNGACVTCDPACSRCFNGTSSGCYSCATNYTFNGTDCVDCDPSCYTCYGPTYDTCIKCKPTYFSMGSMCIDQCQAPLIKKSSTTCKYFCASDEYSYSNGSCYKTCNSPFNSTVKYHYQFCEYPCNGNNSILLLNGSCVSSCSYPLVLVVQSNISMCKYPCSGSNGILHINGSCISSCSYPLTLIIQSNVSMCIYPCSESNSILHQNGSCVSSCSYPLALSF